MLFNPLLGSTLTVGALLTRIWSPLVLQAIVQHFRSRLLSYIRPVELCDSGLDAICTQVPYRRIELEARRVNQVLPVSV